MAEKVTVRGGGSIDGAEFSNAATEATLLRLLDAMRGKKDGTSGQEAKLKELANRALKENTGLVSDSSTVYSGANKSVSGMSTAAKTATSTISKLGDIGASLASGVFSLAVGAGTRLVSFFTDSLDAFRETSSVGASFNNSLIDLRIAAAEAAMPLDQFTDMIKNNSKLMASLGGTVSQGAADFGKLSKELRTSEFGTRMMGMGMTMGDLNDYLSGYLEIQQRSGKITKQIGAEELAGTQAYIAEMDKLTKVTGLSRQQTQDTLRTAMKDGRTQALASRLTGKSLTNFQNSLTLMNNSIDPKAMGSLTNMMSGAIDPGDKFAKVLENVAPGTLNFLSAIGRGEVETEETIKGIVEQSAVIEKFLSTMDPIQIARDESFKSLQEFVTSTKKFTNMSIQEAAKQQNEQSSITQALGSMRQEYDKIIGSITKSVLTGDTFKKIQSSLESLSKKFLEYAPKIGDMFANLISDIDKAFNGNGSVWDGLTNAFARLFDKIAPIVGNLFSSLFKGISGGDRDKRKSDLQTQKAALENKVRNAGGFNNIDPKDVAALNDINDQLAHIDSSPIEGLSKSLNEAFPLFGYLEKAAKGLSFAFDNWGWILGGLVVGGGALALLPMMLGGVGAGLSGVLGPIALVAAAIGLGAGGLGAMFWGVSKVIEAFVDGFKSIPIVIGDLIKLDATQMKDVGVALTTLSDPMIKLAGSGILAKLGGSSGLGSVAEALQKFTSINPETITNLVNPLRDFKETLTLYTGSGILDSFATGIGSLFRGDSGLGKLAEGFKSFNGIDPSGLAQLSRIDTSKLSDIGSAMEPLAAGLKKIGGDSAIKTLFSPNGIVKLSEALASFGGLNANNIDAVVTSIGNMKTIVGADFSTQAASVNTFTDSIKNLNKAITDLNTALSTIATSGRGILGGGPSNLEIVTQALGGANTGGNASSEKLNTLITELVSLTKEIKDSSKDQADALRGRREAL